MRARTMRVQADDTCWSGYTTNKLQWSTPPMVFLKAAECTPSWLGHIAV